MDYGFVRGSDWSCKENELLALINIVHIYWLLINTLDIIWIYLSKSKHPLIEQAQVLLKRLDSYKYASITPGRGEELANSFEFQKLVNNSNYVLRSTSSYASAQNGMAEKPNQDLAQTMRCLLYSAGLGSQFWSHTLRHSVYLKNRRPHTGINNKPPYEFVNRTQPNISHLYVFGSIIHIKIKLSNI